MGMKTMNRRIETMTAKQAHVYRARMRRFHVEPSNFDTDIVGPHLSVFKFARAMAFVADAIDGGPHA